MHPYIIAQLFSFCKSFLKKIALYFAFSFVFFSFILFLLIFILFYAILSLINLSFSEAFYEAY